MSRPTRRRFLRSALSGLAIPFLPSAVPRAARAETVETPRRLLFWYVPNGIHMDGWTPTAAGPAYDLPAILQGLGDVQDDVSVLTGLSADAGSDSRGGDHARGTGCFLTSTLVRYTAGEDIENGISVDQVAAQAIGDQTPLPSLELGIEGGSSTGNCDSGYSCAYARNISWAGPTTPLPKLTDPLLVFERLFGSPAAGSTPEEQARDLLLRTSVLDYALDDAHRLQARLGATDRRKLDEYLTGVRSLETRVQALAEAVCDPDLDLSSGAELPDTVRMMTDLSVAAFECDLTRVITFMLGNGGSGRTHPHLGITESHHSLSHHGNDPATLDKLVRIATWEVEAFADLVRKLGDTRDAMGERLIDHALVMFGSEIEDGNTHRHRNMPVLLAGAGGGAHTPGHHRVYDAHEPVADLYIAMLASLGVHVDTFGDDGTAPLAGLV